MHTWVMRALGPLLIISRVGLVSLHIFLTLFYQKGMEPQSADPIKLSACPKDDSYQSTLDKNFWNPLLKIFSETELVCRFESP